MAIGVIWWLITAVNLNFHPYHVSVCDVEYNADARALQITHHIFLDDLEETLQKRYEGLLDIVNPSNLMERDRLVEEYVMQHFSVSVNGKPKEGSYLGHELEQDAILCYIEIAGIKKIKKISVNNSLLTEQFEDQTNLVHIKIQGETKSLKLMKGNASGEIVYEN